MLDAGGGFAAAIKGIAASTKSLRSAAAEGHFAISEEGGRALLEAIREMRDWLNGQDNRMLVLEQEPPLGSSFGAQAVRPYARDVAADHQGFITILKAFGSSLDDAERGIEDAMANYKTMDKDLSKPYTVEG